MKDNSMSLTTQDLSAIKGIMDTSINSAIDTKVPPMIEAAIETKVPAMIDRANDTLSLQIGQGFNEVTDNFAKVNSRLDNLENDVSELKVDMREVKWGLSDTVRRSEFLDVRTRVERLEHRNPS